MREMTMDEVEHVDGGLSAMEGATLTLGLMAFGAASPVVIGVGAAALIAYALM